MVAKTLCATHYQQQRRGGTLKPKRGGDAPEPSPYDGLPLEVQAILWLRQDMRDYLHEISMKLTTIEAECKTIRSQGGRLQGSAR